MLCKSNIYIFELYGKCRFIEIFNGFCFFQDSFGKDFIIHLSELNLFKYTVIQKPLAIQPKPAKKKVKKLKYIKKEKLVKLKIKKKPKVLKKLSKVSLKTKLLIPKRKITVKPLKRKSKTYHNVLPHLRWFICNLYNWTCLKCGKTKKETRIVTDHIIPKSWGLDSSLDNLQSLCWSCNKYKSNHKAVDYRYLIFKNNEPYLKTPLEKYIDSLNAK